MKLFMFSMFMHYIVVENWFITNEQRCTELRKYCSVGDNCLIQIWDSRRLQLQQFVGFLKTFSWCIFSELIIIAMLYFCQKIIWQKIGSSMYWAWFFLTVCWMNLRWKWILWILLLLLLWIIMTYGSCECSCYCVGLLFQWRMHDS